MLILSGSENIFVKRGRLCGMKSSEKWGDSVIRLVPLAGASDSWRTRWDFPDDMRIEIYGNVKSTTRSHFGS